MVVGRGVFGFEYEDKGCGVDGVGNGCGGVSSRRDDFHISAVFVLAVILTLDEAAGAMVVVIFLVPGMTTINVS